LNPLEVAGADGGAGDPDGDGYTNLEEFVSATDPHNAAPTLGLAVSYSGGRLRLSWRAIIGREYEVEGSGGLPGAFEAEPLAGFPRRATSTNEVADVIRGKKRLRALVPGAAGASEPSLPARIGRNSGHACVAERKVRSVEGVLVVAGMAETMPALCRPSLTETGKRSCGRWTMRSARSALREENGEGWLAAVSPRRRRGAPPAPIGQASRGLTTAPRVVLPRQARCVPRRWRGQ
jgi:hypothetical protein